MRLSHSLFRTEREAPAEAYLVSHQLMIRAGLVRQVSAGIYSLTPLALRVMHRIVRIVKEEMNYVGGQEVLLPVAQPASLWKQSGRYTQIDASLARWKDRSGQDMVLAMTHEEAVTDLARHFVSSYRQLPLMLYQVQTKYRDEARPRGGLVRLREFLMKDAYSFHADMDSLDAFYEQMIHAYENFYRRCGVDVLKVQADTGMMGGGVSHEFMVVSEGGEDTLVLCRHCGYAANREVAISEKAKNIATSEIKWKLYIVSGEQEVAVGVLSGAEVNNIKLSHVLGTDDFREATVSECEAVGIDEDREWTRTNALGRFRIILDNVFANMALAGFPNATVVDVTMVSEGQLCQNCGHALSTVRGIEVGNIFKLGTQYALPMQANFTDQEGALQPFIMGCYGIGITRMLASILERNYDEKGIVWPETVAPYHYHLIAIGADEAVVQTAENLYHTIGMEAVLYDDRELAAGVKFNDADLLGLPYRLTVSQRSLAAGGVEVRNRRTGETKVVSLETIV